MEDNVVYWWEMYENDFKELIAATRPEIKDVDKFWQEYNEEILNYFDRGFAAGIDVIDVPAVIEDAIAEGIQVRDKSGKA